ncbi:E3 ubiquitin-protein ligase TRIM56-like [Mercenaria mercenaria]|uniref:E3 ubiquitin-protein ligase TRIM56-like n=1 Tax=Mercenaria mercenaria TaxID=6596 RepID=UPI00234F01C3|nr:E3 ubiquitin-protein ligase TRIM56-like [Mercenaria mercenaria]
MATKGSTTDASDELFDFICSPCNKKDRNSEAVKYCVDCQEYLCVPCVESHNSFSVLAGHILVERSKFGNASRTDKKDLPSVPTERCKVHSLKLVDMYCADHDTVGCHVCFTICHKPCRDIHYIPEYVETTKQTENTRKINDEMDKAISEMDNLMKKKQKDIKDNRKTKATFLQEIKAFRKEINEALDRLEHASVAEVEGNCGKQDQEFREELKNIQNTIDKLTTCKAEIVSSQRNPSQQFVNMKISENIISDIKKAGLPSTDKPKGSLSFERNSKILHFLQNHESLAKKPVPMKRGLHEVQRKQSYNVKLNDDVSTCNIWSSCVLDSGDILLADCRNKKIKLFDCETYKVRNSVKMSAAPRSVCNISRAEAAVSLSNKTVQFLSTKNELVPTRSLKFDHDCRGIAVMDGQLVISENDNKAYFYTMNGSRLNIIQKDTTGNYIFTHIREIFVSDDGKMIHVVDSDRGMVTVDRDGNVIWRYSGQELKSAWGVCTDGNCNVFVSGESSKNVVQLGPDGKLLGEVVTKAHGLECPQTVCFDAKRCKLFVSDGNELQVFHVQ